LERNRIKMRKIVWIWVLFMSLPANGQENFASISFGASLPLGNYASTGDLASDGYARTGGAIKFDAGYFPVSYLGIGGSFSFGSNYAIRDSLRNDIRAHVEEHIENLEIPDDSIQYGTGFWNYINLFIGPHFSVRPAQRLYLDFRILGGLSIIRPPDQELVVQVDGNEIYSSATNNTLSYGGMAGAGLRYKLNENLGLKLEADYTMARSRFDYTFDFLHEVAEGVPSIESEFWVSTVEIMVGLAYAF
jgi:opacity protein-like surface antigen